MENIYNYLLNLSLKALKETFIDKGLKSWRDLPRDVEELCSYFGVATDDRISYSTINRNDHIECSLYIKENVGGVIGTTSYVFNWSVSGNGKNIAFKYFSLGDTHKEFSHKFDMYIPGEEQKWNNKLSIRLDYETLLGDFCYSVSTKFKDIVQVLNNSLGENEIGQYVTKVINAYMDGSFAEYMSKYTSAKLIKANYESDGITLIDCMTLINTLYLAHSIYGIELSVEDVVALLCYYTKNYGNGPWAQPIQGADMLISFIENWSFWHHGRYKESYTNAPSKQIFEKLVSTAYEDCRIQSTKNSAFMCVLKDANEELYTLICNAIEDISTKHNIQKKYLWCTKDMDRYYVDSFIDRMKEKNIVDNWKVN